MRALLTFYRAEGKTYVPVAFHRIGLSPRHCYEILVQVRDRTPPDRFVMYGVDVRIEAGRPPLEMLLDVANPGKGKA